MKEKYNIDKALKLEHLGEGEWIEEPDEVSFTHKGFDCLIKRPFYGESPLTEEVIQTSGFGGHLCGYVFLPEDHSFYHNSKNPILDSDGEYLCDNYPNLDVHGGCTFVGEMDGKIAVGFDCGHSGDLIPSIQMVNSRHDVNKIFEEKFEKEFGYLPNPLPEKTYKNIAFVIGELKYLIDELEE